ncbi:Protein T19A5.1 [Aphelenchoides avenae]|nr:Protein T19A5.1 [Aphelenchus avenae]
MSKEAIACVKVALKASKHKDVAHMQLAQIVLRSHRSSDGAADAEKILRRAIEEDDKEPISHFLLGVAVELQGNRSSEASNYKRTSLRLDPSFTEARHDVFADKCSRRQTNGKRRGAKTNCFRLEESDITPGKVHFSYYRCNAVYTGKSYKPPALANIIAPLLEPMRELRLKQLKKQAVDESPAHEQGSSHETPVFPLDYGGFSEERIREHQDLSVIVDLSDYQAGSVTYEQLPAEEPADNDDEDLYIEPTEREAQQDGNVDKSGIRRVAEEPETMSFDSLVRRSDVVRFDAQLPKVLPEPKAELVKKGKFYFKPPTKDSFQDYCYMYRKNSRILDQPSSTYVSVTAKGVDIEKYIDLSSPVPGISNLEPICPEPKRIPLPAFDRLPAYIHREALKFYKPEKALKDALLTLGHDKESMEHVAARLYLAISASKDVGDDDVHWSVTTAASLYWRVKGDAVNAIRCLRHSLNSSPKEMRDVAMVSLASIYLQAGFAHSALVMGGEALKISPDSVVAIHFTLANIYASMGDFPRALMFYYSTVGL